MPATRFAAIACLLALASGEVLASKRVGGYTRKSGTHVSSYRRTNADGRKHNNYSTKGNMNPYTGKKGTK